MKKGQYRHKWTVQTFCDGVYKGVYSGCDTGVVTYKPNLLNARFLFDCETRQRVPGQGILMAKQTADNIASVLNCIRCGYSIRHNITFASVKISDEDLEREPATNKVVKPIVESVEEQPAEPTAEVASEPIRKKVYTLRVNVISGTKQPIVGCVAEYSSRIRFEITNVVSGPDVKENKSLGMSFDNYVIEGVELESCEIPDCLKELFSRGGVAVLPTTEIAV